MGLRFDSVHMRTNSGLEGTFSAVRSVNDARCEDTLEILIAYWHSPSTSTKKGSNRKNEVRKASGGQRQNENKVKEKNKVLEITYRGTREMHIRWMYLY